MMCGKCNGRGIVANPRYYRHSNSEAWEMGIPATKPCKHCGGSGYIIGNIGDIVERLRVAANGVTIKKREAQQVNPVACAGDAVICADMLIEELKSRKHNNN